MAKCDVFDLILRAGRQRLITSQQAQQCLARARRSGANGTPVSPLQIAVQLGYLRPHDVDALRQAAQDRGDRTVPLRLARTIAPYEIHEPIGEGGIATVFRATHRASGREVALKVLFPAHTENPTFVGRFLDEGHLLCRLNHHAIVTGYEVGAWPALGGGHAPGSRRRRVPTDKVRRDARLPDRRSRSSARGAATPPRLYYMSMEYVPSISIQEEIDTYGPLPEGKAIAVVLKVAEALDYLQSEGCVHRDIKPDNILYGAEGGIRLCDLGFARAIEQADAAGLAADHADGRRAAETEESTCGTVQYISPEQARGLRTVDIRSDIYSLGASFFHMVTGQIPFHGKDSMDLMAKQVLQALDSDKYRARGLSPYIGYFIEKMMAKDRDLRYQTPAAVIDDISAVVEGARGFLETPVALGATPPNGVPAVRRGQQVGAGPALAGRAEYEPRLDPAANATATPVAAGVDHWRHASVVTVASAKLPPRSRKPITRRLWRR